MNRVILFSPVGGTDPMSQSNFHDGSMLHIARVYQPAEVYLYMSSEMLAFQAEDDRYRFCLRELAKMQGREMKIEVIERENLQDVQQFDFFYEDFRQILGEIAEGLDDSDTLLLNVSSGTPAMKSGLLVIATLGEYPYKIIQVATPERKMNEHRHDNYDVKLLWELNEDNKDDFENRCLEVQCPSLSVLKHEQIIKKLVSVYDYEAAYEVCTLIPKTQRSRYEHLLELALARLRLDSVKVNLLDKKYESGCIPIKDGKKQKIFEYALNMDIKRKKGEYSDFIRAITPLVVDLFHLTLEKQCQIKIDDYCCIKKGKPNWDKEKLAGTDIGKALDDYFYGDFRSDGVYSIHLLVIMRRLLGDNHNAVKAAENLRRVEEKVRNPAAHEVISLDEEKIVKMTEGYGSEDIMDMVKEIFKYTGINAGAKDWLSYETMNERIIGRIG